MSTQEIFLPAVRYRFNSVLEDAFDQPLYCGSMLRGAFGASLRQISCMTLQRTCDACQFVHNCTYTSIFEPGMNAAGKSTNTIRDVSPPYIVEPPPLGGGLFHPGEEFSFHMVLFGSAIEQFPLILLAWRRALAHGLGSAKVSARLVKVSRIEGGVQEDIWSGDTPQQIFPHKRSTRMVVPSGQREISLRFETPLRLQRHGKVLGSSEITIVDLIVGCLRRAWSVSPDAYGFQDSSRYVDSLIEKARELTGYHELRYVKWSRYSSRQRQKMDLPGLVGHWHVRGELRPFLPAIYLCELLHVGKNISFGLGKYAIESPK